MQIDSKSSTSRLEVFMCRISIKQETISIDFASILIHSQQRHEYEWNVNMLDPATTTSHFFQPIIKIWMQIKELFCRSTGQKMSLKKFYLIIWMTYKQWAIIIRSERLCSNKMLFFFEQLSDSDSTIFSRYVQRCLLRSENAIKICRKI